MDPTASSRIRRTGVLLSKAEVARFLEALKRPDEETVAKLEDLRRRALRLRSRSDALEPGSERASRVPAH